MDRDQWLESVYKTLDERVAPWIAQAPEHFVDGAPTYAAQHMANLLHVMKWYVAAGGGVPNVEMAQRQLLLWLLEPDAPIQPMWTAEVLELRGDLGARGWKRELEMVEANAQAQLYGWTVDGRFDDLSKFFEGKDAKLLERYFTGELRR